MKFCELTECELATMKCIWDAAEPVTCSEIMTQLKTKYELDYKDTTVYTYLKKLMEKKFVDSYRKGVTFYFPIRTEESYRADQLVYNKNFWFDGSAEKLVTALLEAEEVSSEEIKNLKRMLDELDK